MPINGLLDNQMVTEGIAAGAGFALKPGQGHGAGNLCMTKLLATTRYNLAANFNSYADNQLVPAGLWNSGVVSYSVSISFSNFNSAAAACSAIGSTAMSLLYKADSGPVANGTVFYQDANLTTIFPGTNLFKVITTMVGRVNSSGVVGEYQSCSAGSAPPTPTGLYANSIGSEIGLGWNVSSGATGYILFRSTSSRGTYSQVYSGPHTNYTDGPFANNITYFYRVLASNNGQNSALSAIVSATTGAQN